VDGKVKSVGKILDAKQIKDILEKEK